MAMKSLPNCCLKFYFGENQGDFKGSGDFLSQIWNVFVRQLVYVLVTGSYQITNCQLLEQLESWVIKSSQELNFFSLSDKN